MSSIGNAFGNNDFTIEFYINPVLDTNRYVLSSGYFIANQWYIYLLSTGVLQFYVFDYNSTGTPLLATAVNTLTANTSYHVALVRKGATYIFFINGINTVQYISQVPYNIGNNTSIISIGYLAPSGFSYFNGKIDELRITNGIARYTTNFTVSIPTTGYPSIAAPFNVNLLSQAQSLTTETAISASSAAVSTSNLVIDPYYNKVTTLIHFNDGTFADNSVFNNKPINTLTTYSTAQTTVIGTIPIGSAYFNGSSQLIYSSNSCYLFGANNFTIEFFICPIINNTFIFSTSIISSVNYIYLLINNSSKIIFNYTAFTIISKTILLLNNWYNICIVRNDFVISLYINGILDVFGYITTGASIEPSTVSSLLLLFGKTVTSGLSSYSNFQGYLKEFRITVGVARYLSNYTIQSSPFANTNLGIKTTVKDTYDLYWYFVTLLLHFDGVTTYIQDSSNYKVLPSSTNFAIASTARYMFGNSSLYFAPASSTYLVYPSSSNFAFKNSSFTIEFWINWNGTYPSSQTTSRIMGNINWYILLTSSAQISFVISNNITASNLSYTSVSTITSGLWYNIAIIRNKNNLLIFINGNLETSVIYTYQIDDGTNWPLFLGTDGTAGTSATGYYYYGYIDELRITNGIARYTTNYTLSSSQFPSTAPTQLLTLPTVEEVFTNTTAPINNFQQLAVPITYYPASAMTSNITTVTNTSYGAGIYYIIASNTSGSTFAYYAFDNTSSTQWLSGATYTSTSSAFSTSVSGTTRSGEWLQIQLPTPIVLKYYSIQSSATVGTTQSPASFVIAGSTDNVNWFLVDIRTGLTWANNGMLQTFTVSNNILAYTYFRLIGITLVTATASLALAIGEMKLYGFNK